MPGLGPELELGLLARATARQTFQQQQLSWFLVLSFFIFLSPELNNDDSSCGLSSGMYHSAQWSVTRVTQRLQGLKP
jgi:hypothetical protein